MKNHLWSQAILEGCLEIEIPRTGQVGFLHQVFAEIDPVRFAIVSLQNLPCHRLATQNHLIYLVGRAALDWNQFDPDSVRTAQNFQTALVVGLGLSRRTVYRPAPDRSLVPDLGQLNLAAVPAVAVGRSVSWRVQGSLGRQSVFGQG